MKRERFFYEVFSGFVCFSTVCSVKVAFVQILISSTSFVVGKIVLLIVSSSGLEIVPGSQLQEFADLVLVYC